MKTSELLIKWYQKNARNLPWRSTSDPYLIWLSEIILQQTRVAQGLPYYNKFKSAFPTVKDLATASENKVLELWQGLGYYSRARNLHHSAKHIHFNLNGSFPGRYEDIINLKGVGPYTAAAIASFAFNLPYPVIDGNVLRVISRLFAIKSPVNSTRGLAEVKTALNSIFSTDQPALFNQAIMELGSLVCSPTSPDCTNCPLRTKCLAFEHSEQENFPIKLNKLVVKEVNHSYLVFRSNNLTLIEQRKSGIWNKLHQFPLIEKKLQPNEVNSEAIKIIPGKHKIEKTLTTKHLLSHRKILAEFYTIYVDGDLRKAKKPIFEIDIKELGNTYPTSVLIQKYIKTINGK